MMPGMMAGMMPGMQGSPVPDAGQTTGHSGLNMIEPSSKQSAHWLPGSSTVLYILRLLPCFFGCCHSDGPISAHAGTIQAEKIKQARFEVFPQKPSFVLLIEVSEASEDQGM